MKWLIYLFSFLSINLVANQIAMKKLLAVTGEEIFSAEIWTVGGIYLNPFNYLTLYYKYHDAAPTVFQKFLPIAYIGFLLSFLALVGLKLLLTERTLTSEGTAHWATHRDLQKKNLLFPTHGIHDGIICGTWYTGANYEKLFAFLSKVFRSKQQLWSALGILEKIGVFKREYIIDNAPTHAFMCAPSRSGKGIGAVIPTLLNWRGSAIVADLKRENISTCGAYRKYILKHKVLEFAPTDTRPTARFNPLNEIRWGTENEGKDVENVVGIIVGEGNGNDKHWIENAKALIVGVVIHLKYRHAFLNEGLSPDDEHFIETNFYHVREFLMTSMDDDGKTPIPFREKLEKELARTPHFPANIYVPNKTSDLPPLLMNVSLERAQEITIFTDENRKNPHSHPVVTQSFSSFISKPDNEGGSVLSTAVTALGIFGEKIIADNTATSDFILGDIRGRDVPTDLFLVVPPSDIARVGSLFRLILEFIIQRGTEDLEKAKKEHRCLLLIDEFPAFGKMPQLVRELGYIAGYGFKAFLIVQGLDQIKEIYKNFEILTNCETQIYFAPRDEITPKHLSELLGKKTILVKQRSAKEGILQATNITDIEKGRHLLTPAETQTLLRDRSAMIIEGLTVNSPKNKWYINPDLIRKVEVSHRMDKQKNIGLEER